MKKIIFLLLAFAWLSTGAQTVDDVIQKYSATYGGTEAFTKIKSVKITGTLSTQGQEFPLTTQIINGKAVRTDIDIMGNMIINTYKDGKGWKQNALAGASTPTDVTGAELNELKTQSMLVPVLMDYKARGHQAELQGQEDIDGNKAYKIKLTTKEDAKVTTFYIKASDYSLIKSVTDREMMGQTLTVETWYSDLKDFKGAKIFMSRVQKINGEEFQSLKFDNIELNAPIDEKIFDKP